MFESTHVFYVPGSHCIIDEVRADGRSLIKGETLAEIAAQFPTVEVWKWDDVLPEIERIAREHYAEPVREITPEAFEEWLCVVPPFRWNRGDGVETFLVGEAITNELYRICGRIEQRHFTMIDSRWLSDLQIAARFREFIQAEQAQAQAEDTNDISPLCHDWEQE